MTLLLWHDAKHSPNKGPRLANKETEIHKRGSRVSPHLAQPLLSAAPQPLRAMVCCSQVMHACACARIRVPGCMCSQVAQPRVRTGEVQTHSAVRCRALSQSGPGLLAGLQVFACRSPGEQTARGLLPATPPARQRPNLQGLSRCGGSGQVSEDGLSGSVSPFS